MLPLFSLRRFIAARNSLPHTVLQNNALNIKAYDYALKDYSALLQRMGDCFIRRSENNCTHISAAVILTITVFALTCEW